ncbi:MAG: Rpp14/Pop5 family protein [Nanoarchaeota archaeon]
MKEKPLLPTLRERKRYLVYEVISDSDFDAYDISESIKSSMQDLVGWKGMAEAGLIFVNKKFSKTAQKGIIRVAHDSLDTLRASFTFIKDIKGRPAIVRSVIASGMIDKAETEISAS